VRAGAASPALHRWAAARFTSPRSAPQPGKCTGRGICPGRMAGEAASRSDRRARRSFPHRGTADNARCTRCGRDYSMPYNSTRRRIVRVRQSASRSSRMQATFMTAGPCFNQRSKSSITTDFSASANSVGRASNIARSLQRFVFRQRGCRSFDRRSTGSHTSIGCLRWTQFGPALTSRGCRSVGARDRFLRRAISRRSPTSCARK